MCFWNASNEHAASKTRTFHSDEEINAKTVFPSFTRDGGDTSHPQLVSDSDSIQHKRFTM